MRHQGLTKATGIVSFLGNYFSFFSFSSYIPMPFLPPPYILYFLSVLLNFKRSILRQFVCSIMLGSPSSKRVPQISRKKKSQIWVLKNAESLVCERKLRAASNYGYLGGWLPMVKISIYNNQNSKYNFYFLTADTPKLAKIILWECQQWHINGVWDCQ